MQKQIVVIGVVIVSQQLLNFSDPATVTALRAAFVVVSGLLWLTWQRVIASIAARADMREVWVKKKVEAPSLLAALGAGAPEAPPAPGDWVKVKIGAYEAEKAAAASAAVLQAPVLNIGLSFAMGIHLPLLISSVTALWTAAEDPLIQMHIFGLTLVRPHGEKDEDPAVALQATPAATAVAGELSSSADTAVSPTAAVAASRDHAECEEVIFSTWEARDEPVAGDVFDRLAASGAPIATYATAKDGWTALMVVSGGRQHPRSALAALLRLGAPVSAVDADGWTALCWTAYHDNAAAATQLIAHSLAVGGAPALRALLAHRDNAGRTALEIADAEGSVATASALRDASASLAAAERDADAASLAAEQRAAAEVRDSAAADEAPAGRAAALAAAADEAAIAAAAVAVAAAEAAAAVRVAAEVQVARSAASAALAAATEALVDAADASREASARVTEEEPSPPQPSPTPAVDEALATAAEEAPAPSVEESSAPAPAAGARRRRQA